jgi:hypothetical protein
VHLRRPRGTRDDPRARGRRRALLQPAGRLERELDVPETNRLLFEAAWVRNFYHRTQKRIDNTKDVIAITDTGLNLIYGSRPFQSLAVPGYQTAPDIRSHEKADGVVRHRLADVQGRR